MASAAELPPTTRRKSRRRMEGVYPISAFDITRRSHEYTIKTQLFQGNQPAGPAPDRQRVGYLYAPGRLAEAAGSPRGDELRRHALRAHTRPDRSEEHTSELQSHSDLVCRLLLEKKKKIH